MIYEFPPITSPLKILDIGARAVPGDGPGYAKLFPAIQCSVTAVDPDDSTNDLLKGRSNTAVHNVALGSGRNETLHITNMPSCSSILPPNLKSVAQYCGMEYFYRVAHKTPIVTTQLDTYFPTGNFDYLDIDVQGYELEILRHGMKNLSNLSAIQIEVGFIEKYQHQALFSEVNGFLISQGFQFHCFTGYGTRAPHGIELNGDITSGTNQWLWADAVYFRNFDDEAFWQEESRLIKMAAIFHSIYNSYDFAAKALLMHDSFNNSCILNSYLEHLEHIGHQIAIKQEDELYLANIVKRLNYPYP